VKGGRERRLDRKERKLEREETQRRRNGKNNRD
jgi:hypothetical protein